VETKQKSTRRKNFLIVATLGFALMCIFFCIYIITSSSPTTMEKVTPQAEDKNIAPTIVKSTSTEVVTVTNTPVPEHFIKEIGIVANDLGSNILDIREENLLGIENPKGEGVLVYVEQTRFSGVERYIMWLVLDETAYPLNGTTKDVTPSFPWPREAPENIWSRTNLNKYSAATDVIEILFDLPSNQSPVDEMSALEQMEIAFDGGYTKENIQNNLDATMKLYNLSITEENYKRAGSVLVTLRKEYGVIEMDILKCMIQSHVSGVDISFPDEAAICTAILSPE